MRRAFIIWKEKALYSLSGSTPYLHQIHSLYMEARHTHNASPLAGTACPERRSLWLPKLVAAELAAALAGPRAEPTNPKCPVTLEAAVSNKNPHSPTQPSHSPASWQLVSGQQIDSKAWSCRCGFYGHPAIPFCGKLGTTSSNRDHLSSPMPVPARRPTSAASHHSRTQAHKNDNENRLGEPCRKNPRHTLSPQTQLQVCIISC